MWTHSCKPGFVAEARFGARVEMPLGTRVLRVDVIFGTRVGGSASVRAIGERQTYPLGRKVSAERILLGRTVFFVGSKGERQTYPVGSKGEGRETHIDVKSFTILTAFSEFVES